MVWCVRYIVNTNIHTFDAFQEYICCKHTGELTLQSMSRKDSSSQVHISNQTQPSYHPQEVSSWDFFEMSVFVSFQQCHC